jgi:hypothetical protein
MPPSLRNYNVGCVCALAIELAAAQEMLDIEHEDLDHDANDTNIYTLGQIGEHNIVIACLPAGKAGTKLGRGRRRPPKDGVSVHTVVPDGAYMLWKHCLLLST